MASEELNPPRLAFLAAEWPRAVWAVVRTGARWRELGHGPRGDGRPVLLLPGLFNSDRSNVLLRRHLARLGYRAEGWGLGRNFGTRTIGDDAEQLIERVARFAAETGQPVTLIGVSLGGIMARLVAARRPELVREVITIASPYATHPRATRVWRLFQWMTGESIDGPRVTAMREELAAPLRVPAAAIWSASDGLVNGFGCRGPKCDAFEVRSGHLGVQLHPDVLHLVATLLDRARS